MTRKSQVAGSSYTILVVDDQQEALISVRRLLEREGHTVLTAEGGERALALFKQHEIHLILVDYFMPRVTSELLLREIRKFDPFVQIILLTGYSAEKPARMVLADLDIQGYHDKAEGPEKLLLWVDLGLKAHRMIRSLRERECLHAELVANVSHEFRTPLNIIGGYTGLLLDGAFGKLPGTAEQPLRSMAEATDNLTELVSDFLNYSKLESRAMEVSRQSIRISELARELERLGSLLLDGKHVRFAVELCAAPVALVTDSVKLRTVLRNLLTNAVKFTASGAVVVRIARRGAALHFSVRDTGPGISRADLAVIFEPFRQLHAAGARNPGGIGLGLALSRKLARILGGDIEVESQPGKGSTFTLVLPLAVCGSRAPDAPQHLRSTADTQASAPAHSL